MKGKFPALIVLVLALATVPAGAQTPPAFTWQSLDVPGAEWTFATGINARGDVVGYYRLDGIDHGFLFRNGALTTIDAPEPTTFITWPTGISNSGRVVGFYRYPGDCPECPPWLNFQMRGFTWKDGDFETVEVPGSSYTLVNGINAEGDMVGEYWDGKAYGFLLKDGTFTTLDMAATASDPASWSAAYGISAPGAVAGWYGSGETWEFHGYLLREGEKTTIDAPGYTWNLAVAVNAQGEVVLSSHENWAVAANWLWKAGTLTRIPQFPGAVWTEVHGINDNGVIVGAYGASDGTTHGFVAKMRR